MRRIRKVPAQGPPVMVIESSGESLYSLRFILESLGYSVIVPVKGRELAEQVRVDRPGVVLIDLLRPDAGGLRAVEELRASAPAGVRIVAVTADVVPYSEAEIRAAGADEILVKPYTVSDLQSKVPF